MMPKAKNTVFMVSDITPLMLVQVIKVSFLARYDEIKDRHRGGVLRWYETPRLKSALGVRGGIGMFPTKAPTFAPGSLLSKTPSARNRFPNPISA